jgi:hypothetical protein
VSSRVVLLRVPKKTRNGIAEQLLASCTLTRLNVDKPSVGNDARRCPIHRNPCTGPFVACEGIFRQVEGCGGSVPGVPD